MRGARAAAVDIKYIFAGKWNVKKCNQSFSMKTNVSRGENILENIFNSRKDAKRAFFRASLED